MKVCLLIEIKISKHIPSQILCVNCFILLIFFLFKIYVFKNKKKNYFLNHDNINRNVMFILYNVSGRTAKKKCVFILIIYLVIKLYSIQQMTVFIFPIISELLWNSILGNPNRFYSNRTRSII